MKVINSYQFRIYPTPEQQEDLFKTIGCARKTYNLTLEFYQELYSSFQNKNIDKDQYLQEKKSFSPGRFKKDYPYLSEVDSTALKYAKKHCDRAYKNFFEGNAEFPTFKKKNKSKWSYTTCRAGKSISNLRLEKKGRLVLPKIKGKIKTVVHRNPKGVLVSATITRKRSGKWFVSLKYEQHVVNPKIPSDISHPVGIDMGIKDLAILSDETVFPNMKHAYHAQKTLSRLDRKLSRQQENAKKNGVSLDDCSNYQKTKIKRAKVYEKVKNKRADYLHKTTSDIVKNHDFIAVESLSSTNLMKNHNLAYAISDASWNTFSTMLSYKCEKCNSIIQFIDRFYASTQICSHCGEKCGPSGVKDLGIREWICSNCGKYHDRDVNAAQNILYKGIETYLSENTIGTMGEEDNKHLQSLINNDSIELSSQEKFIDQKLSVAYD